MIIRAWIVAILLAIAPPALAQFDNSGSPPTCAGDLTGVYPNCVVSTAGGSAIATQNASGQVGSMKAGVAPSLIGVLNSSVTASTSSDTDCYSGTIIGSGMMIPANGPYAGNSYRLICSGVYTIGIAVSTVSNLPFALEVLCTLRAIGVSGGAICSGTITFATASTTTVQSMISSGASAVSVDTTTPNAWQLTAALTSITGSPSVTATGGSIEILY